MVHFLFTHATTALGRATHGSSHEPQDAFVPSVTQRPPSQAVVPSGHDVSHRLPATSVTQNEVWAHCVVQTPHDDGDDNGASHPLQGIWSQSAKPRAQSETQTPFVQVA